VPDYADPGPGRDTDGDGYSDLIELALGSDPEKEGDHPPLGDADGNGTVDFSDAVAVFNIFLGNFDPANYSPEHLQDLNRDGIIDSVDGVILFNFYLGNIQVIPIR
jgi:hypothetical protein